MSLAYIFSQVFGDGKSSTPAPQAVPAPDPLVARLRTGDQPAFEDVVRMYDIPLRRFAARFFETEASADDLVQEVFVWLWEQRSTLHDGIVLRPYLYAAVRNRALTMLRRTDLEARVALLTVPGTPAPGMGASPLAPDRDVENKELAATLVAAFNALSPRVRQVALLRWRDGLSRDEIAHVLGVSPATVKNQLAVAVRTLRDLLKDVAQQRGDDQRAHDQHARHHAADHPSGNHQPAGRHHPDPPDF